MIHNQLFRFLKPQDHRKGIILEKGNYIDTGFHKYANTYAFHNKPPDNSLAVIKGVQNPNSVVSWTPNTKGGNRDNNTEKTNTTTTFTSNSQSLTGLSPFGTPIYYDSVSILEGNNTLCPVTLGIDTSNKSIPVAIVVEKLEAIKTNGNPASGVEAIVAWTTTVTIDNKTYNVINFAYKIGETARPNAYYDCIPLGWSVYWGSCIIDHTICYRNNVDESYQPNYFTRYAKLEEIVKQAKYAGLSLTIRATGDKYTETNDPNSPYFFTTCCLDCGMGSCGCQCNIRLNYRIKIFYIRNYWLWDKV